MKALDRVYDSVNTAIFLPAGGSRRLEQALVDALDVRPGQRVLELGCGTGQVTARLLAAGASVMAVDAMPDMIVGAPAAGTGRDVRRGRRLRRRGRRRLRPGRAVEGIDGNVIGPLPVADHSVSGTR